MTNRGDWISGRDPSPASQVQDDNKEGAMLRLPHLRERYAITSFRMTKEKGMTREGLHYHPSDFFLVVRIK